MPSALTSASFSPLLPKLDATKVRSRMLTTPSLLTSSAGCTGAAGCSSHNNILPSSPILARVLPSGLNTMPITGPVCAVRVCISLPVATSHRRSVLSLLPLARILLSGLNAMLTIASVCFVRVCISLPVATSHRRTMPSCQALPLAKCYHPD